MFDELRSVLSFKKKPVVVVDTDMEAGTGLDIKKLAESGHKVMMVGPSGGTTGIVNAIRKAEVEGKNPLVVVDSISQEKPKCPACDAGIPKRKAGVDSAVTVATVISSLGWAMPFPKRKTAVEMVKCALPGCETLTPHHGGYCCAEHCKKHRRELRYVRTA